MASLTQPITEAARLQALLEVTRALAREISLDEVLQLIVERTSTLLDAERTSVFVVDRERGDLWTRTAQLTELREIRLKLDGPGLAAHAARTGETINLPDVYADPRFNPEVDRTTGWRTRSMLVMPMVNHLRDVIGVFQVLNKRRGYFSSDDEELLAALSASAAIALENAQLYAEQRGLFYSFVEALAATIDRRNDQTAGHTGRVTAYSIAIARAYGLPPDEVEMIRLAAILHDYGKIAVPDAVLAKTGPLTDDEYRLVRDHARHTAEILSKIRLPRGLAALPEIAAQHHERLDGGGYPWGLRGDEIPLGSRIIAVADTCDALTSRRYYKEALPLSKALATIRRESGSAFDPLVVAAFVSAQPEIRRIYRLHRTQALAGR